MHFRRSLACFLAALTLTACIDFSPFSPVHPESPVDPLPLPPEIESNKDLSVKPGDSFYDYCNGTWLKSHPIPATGTIGTVYDADPVMEERVEQLKASVPDIGRFFELLDHMHEQPEKTRAYIDAQKARFPKPATREEAFLTLGRMLADGNNLWSSPLMPVWTMKWVNGKMMGYLFPLVQIPVPPQDTDPENLVPLTATKAGENSAAALMVRGMGLDPSQFVSDPAADAFWLQMESMSLEDLCQLIEECWDNFEVFVSEEQMEKAGKKKKDVQLGARLSLNYTLSYHLAQKYISPDFKQKYQTIAKEIQESLRNRIRNVSWMSQTTRDNALEKLDNYGVFVACPDEWHKDCISSLADCETLAEAVQRNNRGNFRLMSQLLGGKDLFSYQLLQALLSSDHTYVPLDLTLVNAMYAPLQNSVFIYPAILLPPILPENISDAYAYAVFCLIGHEFTHGFDTQGSKYDKDGNERNWWTVADKMAFEERRQNIIQCYNHLELDPERAPGVYGDGDRTQTENIADLGGFLTALDAYKAHLKKEGFFGKVYEDQLRKFYECYANFWCVQYGAEKFGFLQKTDVHSHARLRVNGVVMNTDLWYQLYDVDRNNYLYLPTERRTYIW